MQAEAAAADHGVEHVQGGSDIRRAEEHQAEDDAGEREQHRRHDEQRRVLVPIELPALAQQAPAVIDGEVDAVQRRRTARTASPPRARCR